MNKKYKAIIFDMDGTVVDTYKGIYHSYRYACEKLKIYFPGADFVKSAIGNNLLHVFSDVLHLDEKTAKTAVGFYREYYAEFGLYEAELYPCFIETLCALANQGFSLGIATLKKEQFAKIILQNLGVFGFFKSIYGMNDGDTLSKSELIVQCMSKMSIGAEQTLFVGDSLFDAQGAERAGVDFCAAMYGYGFTNEDSLSTILHCCKISRITELLRLVAPN